MAEENGEQELISSHRLPTLSAAQALQAEDQASHQSISLGLNRIDALLQSGGFNRGNSSTSTNGLARGRVVEVFGPPGIGKTTLCMQVAAAALDSGGKVLWIDTTAQVVGHRLKQILQGYVKTSCPTSADEELEDDINKKLSLLSHCVAPTFPHLLALLSSPSSSFPADGTVVCVIDSMSATLDNYYPRYVEARYHKSNQNDPNRWLADRRPAAMADVGSKLAKLAVSKNIAIILTSTVATKIRVSTSALLRPALAGQEWDNLVSVRLAMYRDWLDHFESTPNILARSSRFLGLLERGQNTQTGNLSKVVPFWIDAAGIHEINETFHANNLVSIKDMQGAHFKKRRYEEVDDSANDKDSSSDYGWENEDQLAAEGLIDASFS